MIPTPKQYKKRNQWPIYNIWRCMRVRCRNKNHPIYGGRGITVCSEWEIFDNFYRDMGERPDGMSIDRIDNSKGYSKENCRWATPRQQVENSRNAKHIEVNGITKTVAGWARHFGITHTALSHAAKNKNIPIADVIKIRAT